MGLSGFIPGMTTPPVRPGMDDVVVKQRLGAAMGGFPVNVLHNLSTSRSGSGGSPPRAVPVLRTSLPRAWSSTMTSNSSVTARWTASSPSRTRCTTWPSSTNPRSMNPAV
ncbi:MAG: DUF4383 domain-containing protein [Sphingomonas bacterium]|nr:DUF4383 domain-containing protein [Sphingomonas bacterium]